jgi:hypothetical protein
MCRPRVEAANPRFSLWSALWRHTAPASRTKCRRTAEESRTTLTLIQYCGRQVQLNQSIFRWYKDKSEATIMSTNGVNFQVCDVYLYLCTLYIPFKILSCALRRIEFFYIPICIIQMWLKRDFEYRILSQGLVTIFSPASTLKRRFF